MPIFDQPLHVGKPNIGDRDRFLQLAGEIFDRGWFSNNGPLVKEFESRLADELGARHVIAVCNGTVGLEIAIRAARLSGEVIVPSFTFVATAHALAWQGLTPVFADIDPVTHTLDPESVRRLITPRTTGIIPVHLWGRPADTTGLEELAAEHGLTVLYDAAHAFGVETPSGRIGTFGQAEVFSFHATKFFNSFEGGAITTADDEFADVCRLMRNFGFAGNDNVIHPGTNGKMTEICAAMGLTNLEALPAVVEVNRENHAAYTTALAEIPGISLLPYDGPGRFNYQYVVALVGPDCPVGRDVILDALERENVLARRYFWPGAHRMQPYRNLYPEAGAHLPHTEEVAARVLVLPTGTAVGRSDIDVIAAIMAAAVRDGRP